MLVLLVIVLVTIWKVGETFCFPRFAVHSQRECLQSSFSTRFRSSFHPLFARPRLGDTVVAEVDDIGGSMKEPKIRDGDQISKAWMETSILSSTERLALMVGNVMKVRVVREHPGDIFQVTIPSEANEAISKFSSSANSNSNGQIKNKNGRRDPSIKTGITQVPADGILLNQLKTGQMLKGIVVHATPQLAFISTNVYRHAKGGVFAEVNGLLHKSDMSEDVLSQSRRYSNQGPVLDKGSLITVYVKEIFKNSGRISFTTDSSIRKEQVAEKFVQKRQEGLQRRQSRRLRRQLENVLAGDVVSGTVQKVVTQGIIVEVTSLGPIPVSALIGMRDLPEHLRPPESMSPDNAIKFLQETDFMVGRQLTGGVVRVHPEPDVQRMYNMKLLLEDLGDIPSDRNSEVIDLYPDGNMNAKQLRRAIAGEVNDDDEDNEEVYDDYSDADNENEVSYDDETKDEDELQRQRDIFDIFEELCRADDSNPSRTSILAEDIFDWADIQDMISEGVLQEQDIHAAIKQAGVSMDGFLSFGRFQRVVDFLQAIVDQRNEKASNTITVRGSKSDGKHDHDNGSTSSSESQRGFYEDEDESLYTAEVEKIYRNMTNKAGKVTGAQVRALPEVQQLISDQVLTDQDFDQIITSVLPSVASSNRKQIDTCLVSLKQFRAFLDAIDQQFLQLPAYQNDNNEEESDDAMTGKEEVEYDEDAEDDSFTAEIFELLVSQHSAHPEQMLLPLSGLLQWEEIKEDFNLPLDTVRQIALSVIRGKSTVHDSNSVKRGSKRLKAGGEIEDDSRIMMNLEQFREFLLVMDDTAASATEDEDTSTVDSTDKDSINKTSEETLLLRQWSVMLQSAQDIGKVTVAQLREWDVLQDLLQETAETNNSSTTKIITQENIDRLLCDVMGFTPGKKNVLLKKHLTSIVSETQFRAFYEKLDAWLAAASPDDNDTDDYEDVGVDSELNSESYDNDGIDEEESELSSDELSDALGMTELFEDFQKYAKALRDDQKSSGRTAKSQSSMKSTVKDLRRWEGLQDLLVASDLSTSVFDAVLAEVVQEQTQRVVKKLDAVEVTETLFAALVGRLLNLASESSNNSTFDASSEAADTAAVDEDDDEENETDIEEEEFNEDNVELEEVSEEELRSIYESLIRDHKSSTKKKAKNEATPQLLPVQALYNWPLVQQIIDQRAMSEQTLETILSSLTGQSTPKHLTFEQFRQVFGLLEEAMSLVLGEDDYAEDESAAAVESILDHDDEEDQEDMLDEEFMKMSDEERQAMLLEVYRSLLPGVQNSGLRKKTSKLTVKEVLHWDMVQESIAEGWVTLKEVAGLLRSILRLPKEKKPGASAVKTDFHSVVVSEDVFVRFTEELDELLIARVNAADADEEDVEEEESILNVVPVKSAKVHSSLDHKPEASTDNRVPRESRTQKVLSTDISTSVGSSNNKYNHNTGVTSSLVTGSKRSSRGTALKMSAWDDIEISSSTPSNQQQQQKQQFRQRPKGLSPEQEMKMKRSTPAGFGRVSQAEIDAGKLRAKNKKIAAIGTPGNGPHSLSYDDDDHDENDTKNRYEVEDLDEQLQHLNLAEELQDEEEDSVLNIFEQLRGPDGKVSLDRFRNWEDLQELLQCGALQEAAVERALVSVLGNSNTNPETSNFYRGAGHTQHSSSKNHPPASISLDYMQFALVLEAMQDSIDFSRVQETLKLETTRDIEETIEALAQRKYTTQKEELRALVQADFQQLQRDRQRLKNNQQQNQQLQQQPQKQQQSSMVSTSPTAMQEAYEGNETSQEVLRVSVSPSAHEKSAKTAKTGHVEKEVEYEDEEEEEIEEEEGNFDSDQQEQQQARAIFLQLLQLQSSEPSASTTNNSNINIDNAATSYQQQKPKLTKRDLQKVETGRLSLQTLLAWDEIQTLRSLQILPEELLTAAFSAILQLEHQNASVSTRGMATPIHSKDKPLTSLTDERIPSITIDFQQFFDLLALLTSHLDNEKLETELRKLGFGTPEESEEIRAEYAKAFGDEEAEEAQVLVNMVANSSDASVAGKVNATRHFTDDTNDLDIEDTEAVWRDLFSGLPTDAEDVLEEQRMFLRLLRMEHPAIDAVLNQNPKQKVIKVKEEEEDENENENEQVETLTKEEAEYVERESISMRTLLQWDELRELVSSSLLSKAQLQQLLQELERSLMTTRDRLHFGDFQQFMKRLDETLLAAFDGSFNDSSGEDANDEVEEEV